MAKSKATKNILVLALTAGLLLGVTPALWAQTETKPPEAKPEAAAPAKEEVKKEEVKAVEPPAADKPQFSTQVDILSQYVFRGIAFSRDSAVIQPSFTASYKGFSANIWGNFDTNERNPVGLAFLRANRNSPKWNETDFTLSYSREVLKGLTLTAGTIYYALDSNASRFDQWEIYGGFGYKFPWFEAGFAAYREISHAPGWYLQWYVSRSFDLKFLPIEGVTLDLYASWSAEISYDKEIYPVPRAVRSTFRNEFYQSLHAGHVMAAVNFPVGKYVKITPKVMYWYALGGQSTPVIKNLSWDLRQNHILGGITINASF